MRDSGSRQQRAPRRTSRASARMRGPMNGERASVVTSSTRRFRRASRRSNKARKACTTSGREQTARVDLRRCLDALRSEARTQIEPAAQHRVLGSLPRLRSGVRSPLPASAAQIPWTQCTAVYVQNQPVDPRGITPAIEPQRLVPQDSGTTRQPPAGSNCLMLRPLGSL